MASRYFGVSAGLNLEAVAEGSSTTSKNIELVVDLTTTLVNDGTTTRGIRKSEVLLALVLFEEYITRVQWPPA